MTNESRSKGILRLKHHREVLEAVEERMEDQRTRFEALAQKQPTPAFSSFNLFTTPLPLARQVIELADIHAGHSVLEPSAGTGNLLRAIADKFVQPGEHHIHATAVEIYGPLFNHLSDSEFAMWVTARNANFLTWETRETFDRVVMNPPFKNGVDRKHIMRARSLLKPDGKLVAICANGPRQRRDLFSIADQWIDLPRGSFRSEGTDVEAAIIVMSAT